MAAKKNQQEETKPVVKPEVDAEFAEFAELAMGEEETPKGFNDETKLDVDGWWSAAKNFGFKGEIAQYFEIVDERRGRKRKVVLIRLTAPTIAKVGRGRDKQVVRLEAGQILGVTLTHALLPILEYVEHRGKVKARVTGQKDVGQPEPMWTYQLECAGKKSAPPTPQQIDPSDNGSDDIPF